MEYIYELIVKENRELSDEEAADSDYPRRKLLSTVLKHLLDADFSVRLKYLGSKEEEHPNQEELKLERMEIEEEL